MLSIVIPIYNEEKYLASYLKDLIKQLTQKRISFEIILSENGSLDGTVAVAKNLLKKQKNLILISSPFPDYGLAVKRGFLSAHGEYLVLFDLDYYDVNFLIKALPALKQYDGIIAAKKGKGSHDQRDFIRRLVTNIFTQTLHFVFNLHLSDTHGIKIINRQKFLPIIRRCRYGKEIFDTELLIRAEYEGLKLGEIGVKVNELRQSRSSIFKRIMRTLKDLVLLKLTLLNEYQ